jgi:drug/metabolite transporter (DMT)-like permease
VSGPSVALALLAACANACSSVPQRKAARQSPDAKSLRPSLIGDLLHRPAWFAGLAGVVAGFLLQSAALAMGSLVTVQPILVFELPLTLLLASRVLHSRMGRDVWLAASMMAVGLSVLLFSAAPQGGRASLSAVQWLIGVAGTLSLIALALWLGRRHRGAARAAFLGTAAGATFGFTAALMKAATSAFESGPVEGLTAWQTYGMVAAGAAAMFILQSALQAGRLAAAQPGITLADPVVASVWGLFLFGEQARLGLYLIGEIGGGAMIVAAVVVLARSPYLAGQRGRLEEAAPASEGGQG